MLDLAEIEYDVPNCLASERQKLIKVKYWGFHA